MKFSVITVCFNNAATIAETLDSVAAQTCSNVEHIVIDGASHDGTQDIVAAKGSRVSHHVSEPDAGIYDAMNKGVALASGDVICMLNADDVYAGDHVLSVVERQMRAHGLDALLGDVAYVNPSNPGRPVRRYDSGRFSPNRISWGWMPAHPALFLRRMVYERTGPFRTDYRIAGDFEFVVRAFKDGHLRYAHWPEVLVMMRTGGVSTAGWRNTLLLNHEVLRACRENGIPTNMFKLLSKYPVKLLEYLRR